MLINDLFDIVPIDEEIEIWDVQERFEWACYDGRDSIPECLNDEPIAMIKAERCGTIRVLVDRTPLELALLFVDYCEQLPYGVELNLEGR